MSFDFSDIRYYTDEEFRAIRMKLAREPAMIEIMQFFFPGKTKEDIYRFFESLNTVRDFQLKFVAPIIGEIVKRTTTEFTVSGIENVDPSKKYLFISNHRNIVLDSALMNYALYRTFGEKFTTTANAIGHNLLVKPFVNHLLRANKSFIVKRALKPHEMLVNSQILSAYIRKLITDDESSVWIAQREGRTKDGNDRTQAGLIKMLSMSGEKDFVKNFSQLHILPFSISYEYDPCDINKVRELAIIENGQKYVKGPMEDYESMKRGTMGWKGRIHIHFGKEMTEDVYRQIEENQPLNKKIKEVAEYIDRQIHTGYKLYPVSYWAADRLNGNDTFSNHYTPEEKQKFTAEMETKLAALKEGDPKQHENIYLKMYANPLFNQLEATGKTQS